MSTAWRRSETPDEPPTPSARTVRTDDGVDLHVEIEDGPGPTVVLTHGFTASSPEWEEQLPVLRGRARIVRWDHRGHGRSSWTPLRRATIDRTARDLATVLDAVVPTGPIVLAGHSMGGMTIMALARRRPELFGDRVVGVFLLATAASRLVDRGPVGSGVATLRRLHLLNAGLGGLTLVAPGLERVRRRDGERARRVVRHFLFGRDDADPAAVRRVQELLERTPFPVMMAFWATFVGHDEEAALPVLARVPVAVVSASHDQLTPPRHGRRLAQLLGDAAELTVVPGAGHAVNTTRPEAVNRALAALMTRAEAYAASRSAG